MAYEHNLECISLEAAADLSAKQFYFVYVDGNGKVNAPSSAGGAVLGVLQNKPTSGQTAQVAFSGVTKIALGATITPDDPIMSKNDGTADVAVAAASPGNFMRGQAILGGASGEIGTMVLTPTGYMTNAT